MEKNNSSDSSVCSKIRQALASNPAVRAIHHISSYHHEPKPVTYSNSPSSFPTGTDIQTKPQLPQHHKAIAEGSGEIPIKFDHSSPTRMGNGKSAVSSACGQTAKVASPFVGSIQITTKMGAKGENQPMQGKPPTNQGIEQGGGQGTNVAALKKVEVPGPFGAQHGHGMQRSEQQGKKSTDINETFNEYIQRAKVKIRTLSNIGRGQSNPAPDHESHDTNKKENHKDHFSDFIHRARKKIRTTTTVGKTSSLKRG